MVEENGSKPENGIVPEAGAGETVAESSPVPANVVEAKDNGDNSDTDKALKTIDPDNVAEAEGQVKKLPYPKSVFFIISNEFCERFNYYGMRTILVLYLSRQLDYSDDTATVIFHIFTMMVYFLCVFGAIISDSWLGKFKTILYLSLVYICGSIMITLGAMPPLDLPATTFTMIGLALIALGSGGIKPCVAFGGDQFKLPEQVKQMTTFFSLFYFSINSGSFISSFVTPILREDVHCLGEKECYSLAFGIPAVLMAVSIVIFILGKPLYISKPPAGNMVVLVSKTIGNAISTKWREKKTNPREHWLDYADKKYEKSLIEDVKVLMRVLVLYLPLPIFWALFDQQGSRWTFQATRMNGDMGSWDIKPDQLQVLNPLLILIFIPLYDIAFYPALRLVGIRRPLQKLTLGGILAGIAFCISGIVELNLEKTYPTLPTPYSAQLRIFNGENCAYTFNSNLPNLRSIELGAYGYYENKHIPVLEGRFNIDYTLTSDDPNCFSFDSGTYQMFDKEAHSLFLSSKNNTHPLSWFKEFVNKPSRGSPMARTLSNVEPGSTISWKYGKKDVVEHKEPAYLHNITEFSTGDYKVFVNDVEVSKVSLKVGGVYTILITELGNNQYNSKFIEITEPNSVNILWLVPQYVVMTLGEVMFSVTGLEFSYSQAPLAMKSVLQACWLLTVALGNVLVVIIAELDMFDSQASEFFLFAGLMFVDMLLFMWLAYRYKPNNPMADLETEPLTEKDPKHEIKQLEGIDNKAATIDE